MVPNLRRLAYVVGAILAGCLLLSVSSSVRHVAWRRYDYQMDRLRAAPGVETVCHTSSTGLDWHAVETPETWDVTGAGFGDVTGDNSPESVLLVWRPWVDWRIQDWLPGPSPIAGFHDSHGESCHVILIKPETGREIWAGSALPAPLLDLAVGDVDGDGVDELVTLEGSYVRGRDGRASHVDIWEWNGFGFSLTARSAAGSFGQVCLTDLDNNGILDIIVR